MDPGVAPPATLPRPCRGGQTDDRIGDSGETALTRAQVKLARELIADLNASVRNKFRNNPEILAE